MDKIPTITALIALIFSFVSFWSILKVHETSDNIERFLMVIKDRIYIDIAGNLMSTVFFFIFGIILTGAYLPKFVNIEDTMFPTLLVLIPIIFTALILCLVFFLRKFQPQIKYIKYIDNNKQEVHIYKRIDSNIFYGEKNKKKMFLTLNNIDGRELTAVYNKYPKKQKKKDNNFEVEKSSIKKFDKLREYKALLVEEIITQEEFDAKKKELLK